MSKMNARPNILYLGFSGFPFGLAELQKIILISRSVAAEGAQVTVVCRQGIYDQSRYPDIKRLGRFKGIKYVYSSASQFRIQGKMKKIAARLTGKFREFAVIRTMQKKRSFDAAIISSMNFWDLLFYRVVCSLFGIKLLLNYVEHNSALDDRTKLTQKFNDFMFDRFAVRISDGILVISEFLINNIKRLAPSRPYLKIPMMVDASRYDGIKKIETTPYVLFCGAANYCEVIFFIIRSFEMIGNGDLELWLVINGTALKMQEVKDRIAASPYAARIRFYNGLTDDELSSMYTNAKGLLIPLRPTVQDEARFPHKFGEYLSSGNPVVTTNYGEAKFYFRDGENAFVAASYQESDFAEKIRYIMEYPEAAAIVGEAGRKLALEVADYRNYGKKIINFIASLYP